MNTHAAPFRPSSKGPPTRAVRPSPARATLLPKNDSSRAPRPRTFAPCLDHARPLRANTQTAPSPLSFLPPPMSAFFPFPESATRSPKSVTQSSPPTRNLGPRCDHLPLTRPKTQAAPTPHRSPGPPASAVFPSEESATLVPRYAPTASFPSSRPVSLWPSCTQLPPLP